MLVPFIYELRSRKVPVGTQEAVALAKALSMGLHENSLDGFYHTARALCVHTEAHLDQFDDAFLAHFKGVERKSKELHDQLFEWLKEAKENFPELTPEEQAILARAEQERKDEMMARDMARLDSYESADTVYSPYSKKPKSAKPPSVRGKIRAARGNASEARER